MKMLNILHAVLNILPHVKFLSQNYLGSSSSSQYSAVHFYCILTFIIKIHYKQKNLIGTMKKLD